MSFELPPAFTTRMRVQLGEEAEAYFAALEMPYLRGLRLNPEKPVSDAALEAVGGVEGPVPWYPALGRYLHRDSAAGADPLHEAGAYYLQEPSAMAPVSALVPKPGERVLDLCAAPGGKSTQIAAALAGEGLLVCNEPVPSRAKILSRNIERMGIPNALVVSAQPEALAARWAGAFDAVLVDAPCSGEGMFRRHPETRAEWTAAAPAGCAERQRRILACAATMLRPGGRLVYSTCTLSPEENEETVRWFLREHPDFSSCPFSLPGDDGALDAPEGMLRLYPHRVRGEGHFLACLRRAGDAPPVDLLRPAAERLSPPAPAVRAAYEAFAGHLCGLPPANAQLGDALLSAPDLPPLDGVRVLRAGVQLGVLKGKVFAPDHALAMALSPACGLPSLALNREEALRYQSGEALPAPEGMSGWALAVYEGLVLGFGKASGGQFKNHYPKGLRRP